MRYGMIGCGKVFHQRHWPALKGHKDIEIAILCDNDAELLAKTKAITGIEHTTTDWREVVQSKEIDAVLLGVLPDLNPMMVEGAAAAGKHIYVEKPIAATVSEGRRVIELAREAGVKLCIGHQRRYSDCEIRTRELIDQGTLGPIHKVFVTHNLPNQPVIFPPEKWWDWKYRYGHGRWLLWAIHHVDLLCFYLQDEPIRVIAEMGQYGTGGSRESEDNAWGIFRFKRGGMGIVEIGGSQHPCHPETFSREGEERMEVCGAKGTVFHARGRGLFRTNIPAEGSLEPHYSETSMIPIPDDMHNQHRRLHEAFREEIEGDGTPAVTGEDGLRAIEMIMGGYLSVLEGRAVNLPLSDEDLQKIESYKD